MSPATYGVYRIGIVFITFLQAKINTGLFHYAVVSKSDEPHAILWTMFWPMLGLSLVGGGAIVLAARGIALLAAPELQTVLILLILTQPFAASIAWSSAALVRRKAVVLFPGSIKFRTSAPWPAAWRRLS